MPDPSPTLLAEMIASFAESGGLDVPGALAVELSPLSLAAGSFIRGEDFLRVWQVSDGRNIAFVTYTCELGEEGRELSECERMVRTIVFRPVGGVA